MEAIMAKPEHVYAVFFSATGTSRSGALEIANALDPRAITLDLTVINRQDPAPAFSPRDLVVFGAPVYSGKVYQGALERFSRLRGQDTPCVLTVTFGNRAFDHALLQLSDFVRALGFLPIAGAALVGQHTYGQIALGRPNPDDLAQNRAFASQIADLLAEGSLAQPNFPGDPSYAEKSGGGRGRWRPLTDADKCVLCGLCAEECPEQAIDYSDFCTIADELCCACFRCIRVCPTGAKNMDTPAYQEFAQGFTQRLAEPQSNAYFL